jgi:hypothetical protein
VRMVFSGKYKGEWHADNNSAQLWVYGVRMPGARSPGPRSRPGAPLGLHPPDFQPASGKAPSMQARALAQTSDGARPWVLVFGKGDEVMSGLADWAKRENIRAGHLTAVGALSSVRFGWFDKDRRAYRDIPVDEQVECISFLGDVGPPFMSTAVWAAPTVASLAVTYSALSSGRPWRFL